MMKSKIIQFMFAFAWGLISSKPKINQQDRQEVLLVTQCADAARLAPDLVRPISEFAMNQLRSTLPKAEPDYFS